MELFEGHSRRRKCSALNVVGNMVEKCVKVLVVLFWIEEVICQENLRDLYANSQDTGRDCIT